MQAWRMTSLLVRFAIALFGAMMDLFTYLIIRAVFLFVPGLTDAPRTL